MPPCGGGWGLLVLGDEEVFILPINPPYGGAGVIFHPLGDGKQALPGQLAEVVFCDYSHLFSPCLVFALNLFII